ncbi:hypothetical protein [Marinimicrobium sp. ARAG 43.8]|uniref:hypothetical protein n=1 Tax=Marinimicrobium sp. ARAG 43.8 TaxID=3418719 RepID=UPI003CF7FC80
MKINEVSANIDDKLLHLEQQLANLRAARQRVEQDSGAVAVIDRDIQVLTDARAKLQRSRDLVWQVNDLSQQTQQQQRRDRFYQKLGLGLIALSGVALLGILLIYLFLL